MKTEIRNELKEIAASLANIGNENCYRVPDSYFEDFADEVLSKIHLPFTQLPLTAPTPAYFEGLAGTILNKIKGSGTIVEADNEAVRELAALSPLMASIRKANVYTVPANYFANFRVAIPATDKKAKVITMHRSPLHWVRYAAAAIVVGIIAVGGILLFRNNDTTGDNDTSIVESLRKPLATISEDAIVNYLQQSPAELDITPAVLDDNKINVGSFAEQLLNDVPDSAIQDYLQENEEPGEKDSKGI
jgi:hypothetical protein